MQACRCCRWKWRLLCGLEEALRHGRMQSGSLPVRLSTKPLVWLSAQG